MAIPTVYRSTDAGAPVINPATLGSVLAVIRACLVDGYGSKSPAGWTAEYTAAGNNTAVFRNSTAAGGTGCYVRVSNNASSAYCPVTLRTYASMTGVNTGLAPTAASYLYQRPSNGATAVSWELVATATAWWISIWQDGGNNSLGGGGDAISFVASDAYRYFSAGAYANYNPNVSWISTSVGADSSGVSGLSFARDHAGLGSGVDYGAALKWGSSGLGAGGSPATPSVTGAGDACVPFYMASGAVLRGRLPGVYVPLFAAAGLPHATVLTNDLTGLGSECVVWRAATNNDAAVLIETALDWG